MLNSGSSSSNAAGGHAAGRGHRPARIVLSGLLCLSTFLLLLPAPAFCAAPVIAEITVEGLHSISNEELLYLLDLKKGDTVDPLKIRRGIKRAFLIGIFEDIEVSEEALPQVQDRTRIVGQTDNAVALKVIVKERDIIRAIKVSGNSELSGKTVKEHFMFREGQVMRYDLIDQALGELKQALSDRGFPHAEVHVRIEKPGEPYRVDLTIQLKEGLPELIKKISIYGPRDEVLSLMRMTDGDIYDQIRLKKDLEAIKEYYKKKGYINPSVGPYAFFEGELSINVNPGTRLMVTFEGNTVINSKDLLKEMPFSLAGDFRNDLVEEASARITTLYHAKGYPFIQLAPVTRTENSTIELIFFIYEGNEVSVGSITFSGLALNEKSLRDVMSLKEGGVYNPDVLQSDRDVIEDLYNSLGYIYAKVNDPEVKIEGAAAHISFTIVEGERLLIDSVEVRGAQAIPKEEIVKTIAIEKGSPYNEVDVFDARYRVVEMYLERGFNNVAVEIVREIRGPDITVIFDVHEGDPTFFGETIVSGNSRVKDRVIRRELLYNEGAPYNYNLLNKVRQRLYKLGLFTDVTIEPADPYDSRRDVLVRVKEGNAGAIDFGIGYGDYEKLRGFFDISYRNLFGMNRQASLRVEASSIELKYSLTYIDPWFLDRPMPFKAIVFRDNRDERNVDTGDVYYKLKSNGFAVGIEKKIGDHVKAELYYGYSNNDTYDVQPDMILTPEDTGVLRIGAIKPGIIYDTRDNPFDPRRGILAGLNMKIASAVLLSETDFLKVSLDAFGYHELSKWFVVAAAFRCGLAWGFGSTDILPLVERYFLGGRSTVRGYYQNTLGPTGNLGDPTGGNAFMNVNLELRTYLGKGLGIVTFMDAGNVWQKTSEMDMTLKYTVGAGLRYNTPVGPVRVDYGYKLERDPGQPRGIIHFSIGQAF